MKTIIKQSADGIFLRVDNKLDATQGKVFINNHEITDIDTFFKVAEENTRLLEQCKKQKEVIDKAIEYINKYAWQEDIIGGIYTTTGKPVIDRYMQLEWDNCNELLDILKEVEETDTNVGEVE